MSCGPAVQNRNQSRSIRWWDALSDEGFRLFFPLGAAYAAIWPLLWVLAFEFDLPLAETVPPSLWHAHEMLIGAFGAALIGFLTTAAPEWTDSKPLRGWHLWALAGLWFIGRVVGLLGWDGLGLIGAIADVSWLSILLIYILQLSWRQRTDRLLSFAFWLLILLACAAMTRLGFLTGELDLATKSIHMVGFAFLGLLGLALGRITVPVTNLVLDPSEATSPFRPHPGRLHLAPGLVFVALTGEVFGLSQEVTGFLILAVGTAFMDRVAEAFIGRATFHCEILMLGGSSALAGVGLILAGCARLGAPWSDITGLHLAFLGGLGLGGYAVYCIAGKLHTGHPLGQSWLVKTGAVFLCLSALLRIAPDLGYDLPGPFHGLATVSWSFAFLCWLLGFGPLMGRLGSQVPKNS